MPGFLCLIIGTNLYLVGTHLYLRDTNIYLIGTDLYLKGTHLYLNFWGKVLCPKIQARIFISWGKVLGSVYMDSPRRVNPFR